ncbi:MAG TPA: HEAT repeat domain-containing protein [Candidatus Sulfotelmatobacter sp.]
MYRSVVIGVFTFLLSLLPVVPTCVDAQDDLISASLENSVITQHEPVIVDLVVINTSSVVITFDPGYDFRRIQIRVVDPGGRYSARLEPHDGEGMHFSNAFMIDPGSSYTLPILLNNWFDFDLRGNYRVQMTVPVPRERANEFAMKNVSLSLTVLPRNEEQLGLTCADLVHRIRVSASGKSRIVAASALSRIIDPAAVLFIAEVLRDHQFTPMMISALTRIKTKEAIEALVDASKSNDKETRAIANSALISLGHTSYN